MCDESAAHQRYTILHVAHGVHQGTGGAAQAILRLAQETAAAGHRSLLAALALGEEPIVAPPDVELKLYRPTGPRRLGCSRALARELPALVEQADVVHTHFLWSDPMWSAWKWARRLNKPLVVQPHGGLLPAARQRSSLVKRVSFRLCEGPALRAARALVATSEHEAACLRGLGTGARLHVIPLGLDAPAQLPSVESARRTVLCELGAPADGRYILYLGRIDEHKQVDLLIRMLSRLPAKFEAVSLVVVGPIAAALKAELTALAERLGMGRRLFWRDAVFGPEKWAYFRGADVFALASRSENFGFVALESLAAGTPVVASQGTPWSALKDLGVGDWIEADADGYAASVARFLQMAEPQFAALREACRSYAAEHYSWTEARRRLAELYAAVSGK